MRAGLARRRMIGIAVAVLMAAGWAQAGDSHPAVNQDFLRTEAYYQRLLADPARGAERQLFATALPKGGDLHHHYSGAHYAETWLDWMDRAGACLDTATLKAVRPAADPARAAAEGTCRTADEVRRDDDLYRRVLMRWSDKDYDNHTHDQPPPDKQFFDTFAAFGAVAGVAPREGLQLLKQRALAENVQYLETMLRSLSAPPSADVAAAVAQITPVLSGEAAQAAFRQAFQTLEQDAGEQDQIRQYQADLARDAAGLDDAQFTVRFQTYTSRNVAPGLVFTGLYRAFKAASNDALVAGVNLVGPENGVVAMRDYHLHMQMLQFLRTQFPQVRLALHAGELTAGMVPPEGLRDHIRLAVAVAGAQRIGHGVDIAFEQGAWALLDDMHRLGVAVEINLTSNAFILGVRGDQHPLALYQRAGVPVVISTDDAGVSRSSLSQEYALLIDRFRPSYRQLKTLVYASLRHAFLPPAERQRQLLRLDGHFRQFEAQMAGHAARH